MLPLWVREDLRTMTMKRYSTFPKAPALFSVIYRTLVEGGVLALSRDAVGVFSIPIWLGFLDCLNIHGTRVPIILLIIMLYSFFFCFRFENSILKKRLIVDHNALDKRGKIFCVITFLETKTFKTVSKSMQPINMFKSWTRLVAFHIALIPLGKV